MRHTLALSVALIALAATTPSMAGVVLTPAMDVHVRSDLPVTNFAGDDTLWLGKGHDNNQYFRSYFQFDVSALAGQVIQSARLEIYQFATYPAAGGLPCEAHEVLDPWSEATITWNASARLRGDGPGLERRRGQLLPWLHLVGHHRPRAGDGSTAHRITASCSSTISSSPPAPRDTGTSDRASRRCPVNYLFFP